MRDSVLQLQTEKKKIANSVRKNQEIRSGKKPALNSQGLTVPYHNRNSANSKSPENKLQL